MEIDGMVKERVGEQEIIEIVIDKIKRGKDSWTARERVRKKEIARKRESSYCS